MKGEQLADVCRKQLIAVHLFNCTWINWERRLHSASKWSTVFACGRQRPVLLVSYDFCPKFSKAPAFAHSFGLSIKRELLTTANLCSARFVGTGTDYRVACPFSRLWLNHACRMWYIYRKIRTVYSFHSTGWHINLLHLSNFESKWVRSRFIEPFVELRHKSKFSFQYSSYWKENKRFLDDRVYIGYLRH